MKQSAIQKEIKSIKNDLKTLRNRLNTLIENIEDNVEDLSDTSIEKGVGERMLNQADDLFACNNHIGEILEIIDDIPKKVF